VKARDTNRHNSVWSWNLEFIVLRDYSPQRQRISLVYVWFACLAGEERAILMPCACFFSQLFSLESLSLQTQVNSLSTLPACKTSRIAGWLDLTDGFLLLSDHRASCNGSRSRSPSWDRSFLCCHAQSLEEVYSLEILEGIRKYDQGRRRRGEVSLLSWPMMNGIIPCR
jgi:hypothetical protein